LLNPASLLLQISGAAEEPLNEPAPVPVMLHALHYLPSSLCTAVSRSRFRSLGLSLSLEHSGNVVESAAEQAEDDLRDLFQDNSVEAVSKQQLQEMMDGKRDKDTLVVLYAPWCQYSQVSGTSQAPDVCSRCMRCAAQCCQTMHCFNRQRCCICSLASVHQCIP